MKGEGKKRIKGENNKNKRIKKLKMNEKGREKKRK